MLSRHVNLPTHSGGWFIQGHAFGSALAVGRVLLFYCTRALVPPGKKHSRPPFLISCPHQSSHYKLVKDPVRVSIEEFLHLLTDVQGGGETYRAKSSWPNCWSHDPIFSFHGQRLWARWWICQWARTWILHERSVGGCITS